MHFRTFKIIDRLSPLKLPSSFPISTFDKVKHVKDGVYKYYYLCYKWTNNSMQ